MPTLSLLTVVYTKGYDLSLAWCWIYQVNNSEATEYPVEIVLRLVSQYIPLFIVIVYNSYQYFRVLKYLKLADIPNSYVKNSLTRKLKLYPIILVVCQLPIIFVRFSSFGLTLDWHYVAVAGAASSIHGFFNSIAYGLTYEVKAKLKIIQRKPSNFILTEKYIEEVF